MEVIVKNSQLSKTHISKMSYNPINNILACNIDGNDTILFFSLDSESMTFIELFKGMSKPPGSKITMSWTPDGRYIALAAGNVELWEFKEGRIKPVKSYQEDFIEIKILEWSVDSQCYACGGISRTNTIKIRNIETGKVKELQLPQRQTISSISFDPYGKYLFLLLRNNTLEIYSVLNYQKYKSIRLSPQGLKINPVKEIRVPSWSPDFGNFVCPSLDDSRINLAVNLSRTKDFRTKNIFMGHCTSISCCRFNPKLYKWNGQVTSIVAMGDSAGNVSFWRIGTKTDYPEPLLLSNSVEHSMQVVQDLQWDEKGDVLMVNMMKKYIHLIKFLDKRKCFGVELTTEETFALIRETYGSSRATDVNKREIEVFDVNAAGWGELEGKKGEAVNKGRQSEGIVQEKQVAGLQGVQSNRGHVGSSLDNSKNLKKPQEGQMDIEEEIVEEKIVEQQPIQQSIEQPTQKSTITQQPHPIPTPPSFTMNSLMMAPPIIGQSKNEYVKLSQQKVIIGKNNKKRIQPAMMIRKDEMNTMNLNQPMMNNFHMGPNNGTSSTHNMIFFTNSMVQTFPSLQLPLITFMEKQVTLGKNRMLEIKRLNKVTSLEIIDLQQDHEYIARRIFPSVVDYVHVTERFLYVLNQQFLYVFDLELNPKELPLKIGQVHRFLANQEGVVYLINCEGYLIGFDHVRNVNKTLTPVPLHLLLKENFRSETNASQVFSIKEFSMTVNSDVFIVVESQKPNSKNKRQRFLYDTKKNGWSKLDLKEGLLESGFSIRITDSEQNIVKNFFGSLCPSLRQKQYNQQQQSQNQIQLQNPNQSLIKQRQNPSNGVISPQEQQMIFYSKYQQNKIKFYDCLIEYLNGLKNEHKNKQFRNSINQHFFDTQSLNYIKEEEERRCLWERVKKTVGGNILEEFFMVDVGQNKAMVQE